MAGMSAPPIHAIGQSDDYTNSYFIKVPGLWEPQGMQHLRLHLVNVARNWFTGRESDDFSFCNGHRTMKADQYSLSNDRVYEFVRQ